MDPNQQDQLPVVPERPPQAPAFVPQPRPAGLGLGRVLLLVLMVAIGLLEALLLSGLLLLSSMEEAPAAFSQQVSAFTGQSASQGQLPPA